MLKIVVKLLPSIIGPLIGIGIGLCIGLWFKLPDHTVDVFAFVESALGIGLTVIALIVTLGVIQQRAAIETMLATKRDEMIAEVKSKLEIDMLPPLRQQNQTNIMALRNEQSSMQSSLDSAHERIKSLQGQLNNLINHSQQPNTRVK